MPITFSSSGFETNKESSLGKFFVFIDSVFRGIGQVMFQNNTYAGILFLCGILYSSALFATATLVGTLVSTATAYFLRANFSQIRDGFFGFNGALTAIALTFFLESNSLTWAYLIVAAATSTLLMAAALRLFETWKLPTLTAPFVFTTLCFLLACARLGRLHTTQVLPTAGLPSSATVEGVVSLVTLTEGLFQGVSQVFFQENIVTGIFFLLGLLISSRRSFIMALIGSCVGLLSAWLLGASEPAMRSGAFGFNPVLTAIALGSVFLLPSVGSFFYMILGSVLTTIAFSALSAALEPLGMPAMTLPFVIVTWICILASTNFSAIKLK